MIIQLNSKALEDSANPNKTTPKTILKTNCTKTIYENAVTIKNGSDTIANVTNFTIPNNLTNVFVKCGF